MKSYRRFSPPLVGHVREHRFQCGQIAVDVANNRDAHTLEAPTANGTAAPRRREQPKITANRPNVAIASLNTCGEPARVCWESESNGCANIGVSCAATTPITAPTSCALE